MDRYHSEKMISSFVGLGQKSAVVIPTLFLWTVLISQTQHGQIIAIQPSQINQIPCPPAFPSMDEIFKESLLFSDLREILNEFKANASVPYECTYSEETFGNIPKFNEQRCSTNKSLELVCPVTTAPAPPTTVIVTTTKRTTKSPTSIPAFTTSPTRKVARTTHGIPRISTKSTVPGTGTKSTVPGIKDKSTLAVSSPRTVSSLDVTTLIVTPVPGRRTQGDDPRTIIICVFSGVIVALVFLIVCFICRRRLNALPAKAPAVDVGKKNRKRSDRRPLRSISVQDGFEPGFLENGVGIGPQKTEIEVNSNYSKEYVKNGTKWRPGYDQPSETSSQASGSVRSTGHYVLLREDSNISGMSPTEDTTDIFHYNTLRTLDHPHALYLGGFGESSTDLTLPRNRHRQKVEEEEKKRWKEQKEILKQQVGDGKNRVKNKDMPEMETSFCDKINLFENLHKGQPNGDVKHNGQVIMREKPKNNTNKENHAYDNKSLELADESPGSGSGNCSSRASVDTILKANMVLDNLDGHLANQDHYVDTWAAKLNQKPLDDEETASNLSKKSQTSVLEPPAEFRDNEPPLAIVTPSVHNPGKSWHNSNNEYSPQNSYLRNHVGQGSPLNQSPASTTQRTFKSDHGSSSEASTLQSRSSTFEKASSPQNNSFLYNVNWSKPPMDKPSAHVQPQPQMPDRKVEELVTKL